MKHRYLTLLILLAASCSQPQSVSIEHYGVLREIMMEQKIEANIDMNSLARKEHLYGLGALEGLSGEILILDSQAAYSLALDSGLTVMNGFDKKATLLVTSQVNDWKEIPLSQPTRNLGELQNLIREELVKHGLDPSKPSPFLLEGQFKQVGWHVINAARATAQTHEAYKQAGASGMNSNIPGKILGFYSEQHEGVFTHHGSYLHLHILSADQKLLAHVDDLVMDENLTLSLPKSAAQ